MLQKFGGHTPKQQLCKDLKKVVPAQKPFGEQTNLFIPFQKTFLKQTNLFIPLQKTFLEQTNLFIPLPNDFLNSNQLFSIANTPIQKRNAKFINEGYIK